MFIKDWLTEKDGVSWCPIRIAFVGAVVYYLIGSGHDFLDPEFKFMAHAKDWASGMKDILIGGGAVAAKAFTEKEPISDADKDK